MPKPSRGLTPLATVCLLFTGCVTTPPGPLVALADDVTFGKHDAAGLAEGAVAPANRIQAAIVGGGTLLVLSWPLHQIPPAPLHSAAECQNVQAAVLESAAALPDLAALIRSRWVQRAVRFNCRTKGADMNTMTPPADVTTALTALRHCAGWEGAATTRFKAVAVACYFSNDPDATWPLSAGVAA